MSAARRAGASLTPSPVIATTSPRAWSASTIRSLCSGLTRATTRAASSSSRRASSSSPSSRLPASAPVPPMPTSSATRRAVDGWSPVIITTRIPARWASAIAAAACGRGGSIIPTMPSRVRSCSRASSGVGVRRRSGHVGALGHRDGAQRLAGQLEQRRLEPGAGHVVQRAHADRPTTRWVHRSSSTSGAPLTTSTRAPAVVDQHAHPLALRRERRDADARGCPVPTRDPVGAPRAPPRWGPRPPPSGSSSTADRRVGGHRTAAERPDDLGPHVVGHRVRRAGCAPGSNPARSRAASPDAVTTRCTAIDAEVSVPVLSVQITDAEPSVSTDDSRVTIALPASHPLHAQREHHRQHRRQALRHGGHGQRHPEQQHRDHVGRGAQRRGETTVTTTTTAITATAMPRLRPTRPISRCSGVGSAGVCLEERGDPPRLGVRPGRHHHGAAGAAHDLRARQHHAGPVRERRCPTRPAPGSCPPPWTHR